MVKVFCDKCGKEITNYKNINININDPVICENCQQEDLTCSFKIGDAVITSTGEIGRIVSICTCNKCKERGFYELKVAVKNEDRFIWITNNDKRLNFNSFYKIGDYIFGNIDENSVLHDMEFTKKEIYKLQEEMCALGKQLEVIKKLKSTNN